MMVILSATTVCFVPEDLYFGAHWWERRVIPTGKMAGGKGLISWHGRGNFQISENREIIPEKSSLRVV